MTDEGRPTVAERLRERDELIVELKFWGGNGETDSQACMLRVAKFLEPPILETELANRLSRAVSTAALLDQAREALEPFAKMAQHLFVSGHCGGASPEDFPDKWITYICAGPHGLSPQQGATLKVADFNKARKALAALNGTPSPVTTEQLDKLQFGRVLHERPAPKSEGGGE